MTLTRTFRQRLSAALDADPRPRKVIAHQAGYSESYIRSARNPTLTFVEAMAGALGCTSLDLLG